MLKKRRQLTKQELEFVEELKKRKILTKIRGDLLDLRHGAMFVMCSDGDCFHDAFTHHGKLVQEQCGGPRNHVFADNGGPLLLVNRSPVVPAHSTRTSDLLRSIEFGHTRKGMSTLKLVGHTQCAMADECKIDLFRYLNCILAAKTNVKSTLRKLNLKVACFIQVDYSDSFSTYFFDKSLWHQSFSPQSFQ